MRLIQGDCLAVLKTLPANSVQCVVTSPPYYGLRDYGVDGQIGLEPTPDEYVARLVEVFREVRRVLRDDGTLWLNLGDSYNGNNVNRTGQNGYNDGRENRDKRYSNGGIDDLKPKDLIGIPWRVAFAMQSDGWYLRSDIIWHKPNPMPESVTDRPTKSHEYVFLLTKSARYFFDQDAVREESSTPSDSKSSQRFGAPGGKVEATPGRKRKESGKEWINNGRRNIRTVWTIPTQPTHFAHFATFPPKLIEPCILAGSRPGDVVLDPFNGSGTTGQVAIQNGRDYIGIELNPEYITLTEKRLSGIQVVLSCAA